MGSIAQNEERPTAVSVTLQELKDGTVSLDTLEQAFGPASLGIIIVKDLPEQFAQLRREVLSLSSYLANLPEEELGTYSGWTRSDCKSPKLTHPFHSQGREARSKIQRRLVVR